MVMTYSAYGKNKYTNKSENSPYIICFPIIESFRIYKSSHIYLFSKYKIIIFSFIGYVNIFHIFCYRLCTVESSIHK